MSLGRIIDAMDQIDKVRSGVMCLSLLAEPRCSETPSKVIGWLVEKLLDDLKQADADLSAAIRPASNEPGSEPRNCEERHAQ